MAKKFAGFTPDQLGKIVPEMKGMQADEQKKFLAANPAAAKRVGLMSEKAQMALAKGGYIKGYQAGGIARSVAAAVPSAFNDAAMAANKNFNATQPAEQVPYQDLSASRAAEFAQARKEGQARESAGKAFYEKNRSVFEAADQAQQTVERDVFDLINTQWSFPLGLDTGNWDFQLSYNINFPKALTSESDLSTSGYVSFSAGYFFAL